MGNIISRDLNVPVSSRKYCNIISALKNGGKPLLTVSTVFGVNPIRSEELRVGHELGRP